MIDDSETLEELKRRKELNRRTFKKVINKDKLNDFEMDEVFNGY